MMNFDDYEKTLLEETKGLILDYEAMKPHLGVSLCETDKITGLQKSLAYTHEGDFAAIYHLVLPTNKATGRTLFAKITLNLLQKWNITLHQLKRDALEVELSRGIYFMDMDEFLNKLFNGEFSPDDTLLPTDLDDPRLENPNIYILTNSACYYGASLILSNDLLSRISNLLGGDYYILPSSKHEVIIIPTSSNELSLADLSQIVHDANRSDFVSSNDFLSNEVQYYDAYLGTMMNATLLDTMKKSPNQGFIVGTVKLPRKGE